jgi:transglutaminase-like putative cysteine protease
LTQASTPPDADRNVGCQLTFLTDPGTVLALQIAPAATAGTVLAEHLDLTLDGRPPERPAIEVGVDHGGRTHVVNTGAGRLEIAYAATIRPGVPTPPTGTADVDADVITFLRQSRYCPSDALAGFAAVELVGLPAGPGLASAIAEWVFQRLAYALGVSGPLTTAVDTLSANSGACRDFAHLTVALCRARGVPARLAAVYAPGLSPMDFHAVVEARRDGAWEVLDPTRLAPRRSLVRIATGRDAADTAFATTLAGGAELVAAEIFATVDGDLPADDHVVTVALA